MKRTRSRNKSSDKGKIHFYKGRDPTEHEMVLKTDNNQAFVIDEVQQAGTVHMRVVLTWIPQGHRPAMRKGLDKIDPAIKKDKEPKYSNTLPVERLDFYENLLKQEFDVYDSYNLDVPPDVLPEMYRRGYDVDYWRARYIYQVEETIRNAMGNYPGGIDLIFDKPPLDLVDDIRLMVNNLIQEGYNIQWVTITPSRHMAELQVHDFIAGLVYDIRTGWVERDPHIRDMSPQNQRRYGAVVTGMKSRIKNWK